MRFEEKATQMGLVDNGNRTFSYEDVHGAVTYKYLSTPHEPIPYLALFAGQNLNEIEFTRTILSDLYEFEGNENINNIIRQNIRSSNNPILREHPLISRDYCLMYNQVIIDNSTTIQQGTIYPSFIITNSYNGTRKKEISFGINIEGEINVYGGFRNKLGTISQIHSERHSTTISNIFGDYVDIVSRNIADVVNQNMNNELEDNSILTTLEYLEHFGGKRRRENVSAFLNDITNDETRNITSWDLFLSILRYSEVEKNLNMKIAMENLAERALELPRRMIEACQRINQ